MVLWIIIICILAFVAILCWFTISDFNPGLEEPVKITGEGISCNDNYDTLSLVTWNIGYAGLGQKMDFFYEGGNQVRPSYANYSNYQDGILNTLIKIKSCDFLLLQEVDQRAKRSYYGNQVEAINKVFPAYASMFAINYFSKYVPVPVKEPMGYVRSGIMTLSHFTPSGASRHSFRSDYSWPKKLFMLDRCYLIARYMNSVGHELVVINTHNSAFADAAMLRDKELGILRTVMEKEYAKGNYVIIGGDWNQNPLPFNEFLITSGDMMKKIDPPIPMDFLPTGWQWAFDPSQPTNRDVNEPYVHGKAKTTIIDFFVLSPNIELIDVKTLVDGFAFSDHQPVYMKIRLIK
jgi:endonuclease/exonuclease/phosphatase family metal-dependent hydrolase